MNKKLYSLCMLIIALAACNNEPAVIVQKDTVYISNKDTAGKKSPVSAVQDTAEMLRQLVPGQRIGLTKLGESDEQLIAILNKPDFSDAAMGKAWLTWYGKHPDEKGRRTQLDVYVSYSDSSMKKREVKQIRTTSSYFETQQGIKVGSRLAEIRKAFPAIQNSGQYEADKQTIAVFDDVTAGIAFDINGINSCTGIIIHPPGEKAVNIYFNIGK